MSFFADLEILSALASLAAVVGLFFLSTNLKQSKSRTSLVLAFFAGGTVVWVLIGVFPRQQGEIDLEANVDCSLIRPEAPADISCTFSLIDANGIPQPPRESVFWTVEDQHGATVISGEHNDFSHTLQDPGEYIVRASYGTQTTESILVVGQPAPVPLRERTVAVSLTNGSFRSVKSREGTVPASPGHRIVDASLVVVSSRGGSAEILAVNPTGVRYILQARAKPSIFDGGAASRI